MTKEIELTKGYKTTVDDEDFEYLSQFKWCYSEGYAMRTKRVDESKITIYMHQAVMERKIDRNLVSGEKVDHKNRDGLNNTRGNVRLATYTQNAMNRKKRVNSVSQFKGVSQSGPSWSATITVNGHTLRLGSFWDEEEAARSYDQHAILWFGEFANLNFPDEWLELTNRLNLKD